MCLIFLSLCVLKMGNRVREQDPHTVCEVWPPQFPSSEKLLLARGLVCLLLSLSLVLIYVNIYLISECISVTCLCFLGLLLFQFLGTGFLLLLVDLLKCLLLFKFLGIGFASVSVFRNWVCFCFWVFVIFKKCFLIYDHVS